MVIVDILDYVGVECLLHQRESAETGKQLLFGCPCVFASHQESSGSELGTHARARRRHCSGFRCISLLLFRVPLVACLDGRLVAGIAGRTSAVFLVGCVLRFHPLLHLCLPLSLRGRCLSRAVLLCLRLSFAHGLLHVARSVASGRLRLQLFGLANRTLYRLQRTKNRVHLRICNCRYNDRQNNG